MTNEEFLKSITLEGEMWKDVAGYEGCYMVSNFGRVMSLGREVPNSDKSTRIIRPSIMSLNIIKSKRDVIYYTIIFFHLYHSPPQNLHSKRSASLITCSSSFLLTLQLQTGRVSPSILSIKS